MSLRSRVLALFLLLAALPVIGLGAAEYVASLRAMERVIAGQNGRLAERVATSIAERAVILESDLLLLGSNADTQEWLAAMGAGGASRSGAPPFLAEAWERVGVSYASLELQNAEGVEVLRVVRPEDAGIGGRAPLTRIERDIRLADTGRTLGRVAVQPLTASLLPLDLMVGVFGERGWSAVIEDSTGRVLYPRGASPLSNAASLAAFRGVVASPRAGSGRLSFAEGEQVVSWSAVTGLPWTVVVGSAVDEFAEPFLVLRHEALLLFVAVAVIATLLFSTFLRRATHSLEELTHATATVAQGNFAPTLPAPRRDEIGTLTEAFRAMVQRIGEMVEEIRVGRQLAVLGEFAAQLSHEVRNPLTSIKLNLQRLERSVREGKLPTEAERPVELALREVQRLDGVVRGVLDLARVEQEAVRQSSLNAEVREALAVIADQAANQGVVVHAELNATPDELPLRRAAVGRALLNLLLNALEAMPGGGELSVTTRRDGAMLLLTIGDTGPGVPADERQRVFRPFHSTRTNGTGLGLPLARRTIEELGGRIRFVDPPGGRGASLLVEFGEVTT